MAIRITLSFFLGFTLPLCICAQPIIFNYSYSNTSQLPFDMGGFDMAQDRAGFIYWPSVDGVFSFDGYRTKHYQLNNANFKEPQPQFVLSLLIGPDDKVWAGLRNGLAWVNRDSGNLSLVFNFDAKTSDFAFPLVRDANGHIWVDCFDAIPEHGNMVKYEPKTGRKTTFTLSHADGSFFNEQILNLYFDELGMRMICASGSYRIRTISANKGVAEPLQWPGGARNGHLSNLLAKDSSGFYWAVDSLGLLYRGKNLESLSLFKDIPEVTKWKVRDVSIDKKNRAWVIGTKVAVFQIKQNQWQFIVPKGCEADGFQGDYIYKIFHDRRNTHWILSGGPTAPAAFQMLTEYPRTFHYWSAPGSNDKQVFTVYREPGGGDIWLGFISDGVYRLGADWSLKNIYTTATHKLLTNKVIFMAPAGPDELWFNCVPAGISILNKKTGKVRNFEAPDGKPYQECFLLKDGRLLLAAYNQTSIYDPKTGSLRPNEDIPLGSSGSFTFRFVQCVEQEGDTLWLGGYDKHIYMLSLKSGKLQALQTDFIHHNIMSLHRRGSELIIGTLGQGLVIYDLLKKKAVHQFMAPQGFPHHAVMGILEDAKSRLWLFTSTGLVLFEREKLKFTDFNSLDGLPFEGFTSSGFYQDDRGWMYGVLGGFVMFYPDSIKAQRPNYPVIPMITDLFIGGKSVPIAGKHAIDLAADQNYLEVFFSSLDFGFPRIDTFWYKLEGYDTDWQYTTEPKAFISRIPPGHYTLLIKATNRFGVASSNMTRFGIRIRPWWWQSRAFHLGLLLSGGLGLWVLINRYIRRKQLEAKRLRQQVASKSLEALRSQLNHHFIKNSLGRSNAKILSNDIVEANRFLGSLSSLLEKMMFSTQKDFYTLSEELEIINVYLHIQRERWSRIFDYEIQISPDIQSDKCFVPSLLSQPLIENAVEHGLLGKAEAPRNLLVVWSLSGRYLICLIDDNGKGFDAEIPQGEHTGIQNVFARIQLLNELYLMDIDMKIEHKPEGGTRITISLPLMDTLPVMPILKS